MIQASKLTKRFKDRTAVDEVSLNVPEGQIFGLLGPNAAGKTTTLRMLCGIIKSDAGEIRINHAKPADAKHEFGYVAQHFGQYEELSVWENLKFYAQLYNITDKKFLADLLHHYELTPFRKQFAGTLSGGYQRRLALACALAHDPKVLFLDEPTAGIDPVTRKMLWDEFYKLSSQGKTLFVTTHYMEEAQRCHQLAFLSSGRIVAEGTPETIKQALGEATVYVTRLAYHPELRHALLAMSGMILVNQFGNELRIVVDPKIDKQSLQNTITSTTGQSCSLELSDPNLEDVFIALTQHGAPTQ
ncbi:ATP-binding cassette domain-containing protein [Kaarinaea lacus]